MPNFGNSSSRAPRGKAGAGAGKFKPREDGRGGRAPHRADRNDRPATGAPKGKRGAFFEERPAREYGDRPAREAGASRGRGDRPSYGDRPARAERPAYGDRPTYGDRNDRSARPARAGGDREMRDGRQDRGRDWQPRTGGPSRDARDFGPGSRKPRHGAGDRNERPAYGDRDDRRGSAPRDDRRTFDRDLPARGFGSRDDRAPRREFGSRDDRVSRDRREEKFFGGDRNPNRDDRVARDRNRDETFAGARDRNPNKKAFFEDVVLERLEAVEQSEAITSESFEDMGLHPKVLSALAGMGAETPFPIQASTIPAAISGRDVLGRGKTGSGKTIAFTVPLVTKLIAAGSVPRKAGKPRALILAPTRELADQIDRTVNGIARAVGFYTACIYGGVPQRKQENAMGRGVDIVVATPGRLEDLMAQRIIDLSEVETIVVDEADHMCDLGFIEGVRRIMRATGDSQKLLFSATLDREVDALVKEFLPDPYVYEVPNEENDTANIVHRVLTVDPEDRSQVLLRLVQGEGKALIFTRTKMTAERLSESLTQAGVPAARLHGDLNQNQRNRNLERFTKGSVRVLVATDVAARGIHVDDVKLVIQVDPPEEYKTYLHRAGRTGRANKEGTVITLIPRSRRRRLEDLLRRAERDGIFSEVRPSSDLLEQLAGPIAPPPAPEVLDFGDSRGGSGGRGHRGSEGGSRGGSRGRGNYGGSGKGRWADRPAGEKRPRARKFEG